MVTGVGANLASSDKSPKDEHAAGGASDESHPKSASPTTPAHPASSSTPEHQGAHQTFLLPAAVGPLSVDFH
jgi:hypothetical protein